MSATSHYHSRCSDGQGTVSLTTSELKATRVVRGRPPGLLLYVHAVHLPRHRISAGDGKPLQPGLNGGDKSDKGGRGDPTDSAAQLAGCQQAEGNCGLQYPGI